MTSMTITNNIAFAIMTAITLGISTAPISLADAGTVENRWWHSDPGMCYNTGSLDDLTIDGSTGNGADAETEMEKSRSMLNAEMNGITINGDHWLHCYGKHFDVASEDFPNGDYATETTYSESGNFSKLDQSEIRFNTDHDWGTDSNTCSTSDIDIEWVMNHEMGHGIGLNHHWHAIKDSMMYPGCDSAVTDELQAVDKTAIDIKYP